MTHRIEIPAGIWKAKSPAPAAAARAVSAARDFQE